MSAATFLVDGVVYDVDLPECPDCGSTAMRCIRPSGHQTATWHIAREYLLAPLIGMSHWRQSSPALFDLEPTDSRNEGESK